MADPATAPVVRRHGLLALIIAGVCAVLAGAFVLLWFMLPTWAPEWVVEHSPFLDPLIRANTENRSFDDRARERIIGWGPAMVPSLLERLTHRHITTRCLAARCLGELKARQAVTALVLMAMTDPLMEAEHAAIKALGRIGDVRAIRPLVGMLRRDGSPYSSLFNALTEFPDQEVTDAILPLPAGNRFEDRAFLVLAQNLNDARAVSALDTVMREPLPEEVRTDPLKLTGSRNALAATALARSVHPNGIPTLIAAFTDQAEFVRLTAIQGVIGIYNSTVDARLIPPLLGALDDQVASVRKLAAMSFLTIKAPDAEAKLTSMLSDPDPVIRECAMGGLGSTWATPLAISRLAMMMKDPDERVRRAAASSLGRTKNIAALEPMIAALEAADDRLRLAILMAVVSKPFCQDPRAFPLLLALLAETRASRHEMALHALNGLTLSEDQRQRFDAVMQRRTAEAKSEAK